MRKGNSNRGIITMIEQNYHGGWVIYGAYGIKQYYGYTKAQAKKMYLESDKIYVNIRKEER